jgi:hypothetical protein
MTPANRDLALFVGGLTLFGIVVCLMGYCVGR